ncbi:hypothetical protein D9611_002018 [Ephemerocybe angulata]|uniref:Enoyl reductase (ER) domain-containing protein n=1 Tax=Ephemerocybe angulata TaxID=980116 RepID=A0A8H5CK15_9AGAR|nr:hypothetical protein D9611_002018 [Tulosesus angulatus]
MIPTEQKALILQAKFGTFALSSTVSVAKPKAGEVLIKVHAAALNPIDWKIRKYGLFIEEFPTILGSDVAGEVVELGEGVSESQVKVGDRVIFQSSYHGSQYAGFQEYAVGEVDTLAKIPSNITYEEASTVPGCFTTAYIALYNVHPHGFDFDAPVTEGAKGKYNGIPMIVLGGSSSVGQSVIQMAKLSGFSPIITTASLKHAEYLKSLGATHVLDRNKGLTKDQVASITEVPIKAVFDAISVTETQTAGFELLASGGQLVTTLQPIPTLNDKASEEEKWVAWVHGAKKLPSNAELMKGTGSLLTALLENGDVKPNRVEVLSGGLNGIVDGLTRLENDTVSCVKLVVRPQDTA